MSFRDLKAWVDGKRGGYLAIGGRVIDVAASQYVVVPLGELRGAVFTLDPARAEEQAALQRLSIGARS